MVLADLDELRGFENQARSLVIRKAMDLINKYPNLIKELYTLYTEEQVNTALDSGITVAGNYLFMRTSGLSGKILRTLEYGTNRIKALHIITQATRAVVGGIVR